MKSGLEGPEDKVCPLEKEWSLAVEGYTFSMKTYGEREKSLAFARIMGFLLGNELSGSNIFQCHFETFIDANNFRRDIQCLHSKHISISNRNYKRVETQEIMIPVVLRDIFSM